ncbi:hypothetical protein [Dactylosporangium sp. NPDC005555]|uniref:hypothetical protein n=1 Tax=Dactylosporangium sp. NPDC005555 TaxID=3154889 RepID=UPI0033A0F039
MRSDEMTEARNRWIDGVSREVVNALWPGDADRLQLAAELDDPLWRAMTLAHIAMRDLLAYSMTGTAELLSASGLVGGLPEGVVEHLVEPVVRRVRVQGVPGPRWWDVRGLHVLMLELWTARRSVRVPQDQVVAELRRYWAPSSPEVIASLLAVADDPYAQLPASLCAAADAVPATGDRADLRQLQRMITAYRAGGGEAAAWLDALSTVLAGLTVVEQALLAADAVVDYHDGCLAAFAGMYHYEHVGRDALPGSQDEYPRPAPQWAQDQVINGGARCWHGHAGPLPLWFATTENDEHDRLAAPLLRDGRVRLARVSWIS